MTITHEQASEHLHENASLRERKRAATHAAIERTALELALERGYDNTTVEMICDASNVSQRTFFNYFGSKEAVILGVNPAVADDEKRGRFVQSTGDDVLRELVELISSALDGHELDPELFRSRRTLIKRTPDLANAEMVRIMKRQDDLVRLVMSRFEARGRSTETTPDLEDEARMVVTLAAGVIHYAMHQWLHAGSSEDPARLLRDSVALLQRVTSSTTNLDTHQKD